MIDHAAAHERLTDLALDPGAIAAALEPASATSDPELSAHVAACERCRADVATWRAVDASLERALRPAGPGSRADIEPIEAGEGLRRRILAAARSERTNAPAAASSRRLEPGILGRWTRHLPGFNSVFVGLAAALVVAIGGTFLLAGPATELSRTVDEARSLTEVVAATNRILADPAHEVVTLRAGDGSAGGSVAWSSQDLVVLTSALQPPAAGSVYRCWLVGKGHESPIGQMEFAGNTAYWVGSANQWASIALRPGWSFYVTLESGPAGPTRSGPAVLEADITS